MKNARQHNDAQLYRISRGNHAEHTALRDVSKRELFFLLWLLVAALLNVEITLDLHLTQLPDSMRFFDFSETFSFFCGNMLCDVIAIYSI